MRKTIALARICWQAHALDIAKPGAAATIADAMLEQS